jgi:hypothetical protein
MNNEFDSHVVLLLAKGIAASGDEASCRVEPLMAAWHFSACAWRGDCDVQDHICSVPLCTPASVHMMQRPRTALQARSLRPHS